MWIGVRACACGAAHAHVTNQSRVSAAGGAAHPSPLQPLPARQPSQTYLTTD